MNTNTVEESEELALFKRIGRTLLADNALLNKKLRFALNTLRIVANSPHGVRVPAPIKFDSPLPYSANPESLTCDIELCEAHAFARRELDRIEAMQKEDQ